MARGEDLLGHAATTASAEEQSGGLVDRYGGTHLRFTHLLIGQLARQERLNGRRRLPDACTEGVEFRFRGSEGAMGDPLA